MIFQIFRHHNMVLVEQFLDNCYATADPNKILNVSTALNPKHLKAMQSLAQMRSAADDAGMGFAASFSTEDGYHYITSNLIEYDLYDHVLQLLLTVPYQEEDQSGQIQLVETEDGVQLQIVPDFE